MSVNNIEHRIKNYASNPVISQEQKNLARELESALKPLQYEIKEMGSLVKGTTILSSDIDILAIIPLDRRNYDAQTSLNHLKQKLQSPFNPSLGNHSIIVRKNGRSVDVVPAKPTGDPNQYQIPSSNGNTWITRGQDSFTQQFITLDTKLNRKLSATVKILKLWKERKTTLDLSSLSLEAVGYDALKAAPTIITYTDAVIIAFTDLADRITKNIKHPAGGPQLNNLDENSRKLWKDVVEKDSATLKTLDLDKWMKLLNYDF